MSITLRFANEHDIEKLIKVRFDYFSVEKWLVSDEQYKMIECNLRIYFNSNIKTNFVGAFAEEDGEVVSTAFLALSEMPANLSCPTGKKGTILNVLTYPKYQRKGYAKSVLNLLLSEARKRELSYIELSASKLGKPLYQKLGFMEVNKNESFTEMKILLV